MIATMGDFTSTAASVGRTKTAATVNPLSKVAVSVSSFAPAPIGPGDRVEMAKRGEAIVASDPKLRAQKAPFPGDAMTGGGTTGRGFLIAVGTLSGREYKPEAMRQALGATEQVGFDAGVASFRAPSIAVTGSGAPSGGEASSGPSRTTIAIVAVGIAAAAAVAYKLTRK